MAEYQDQFIAFLEVTSFKSIIFARLEMANISSMINTGNSAPAKAKIKLT